MPQPTPGVYLTTPKSGIIPDGLPRTLPAPVNEHTFRAPFGIDPWIFNFVLRPEVPIVFASVYVATVFLLNAYNRKRDFKQPWWIARQSFFPYLVVFHNAVLTIYSAATFLAVGQAIAHAWPGWNNPNGHAGIADALCKMHGPRGLGDATTFNSTINIWESKNDLIKLGHDGNPDPTDVGRIWNEGLAFWGWWFYVSKFYEVLDTLIILAKGKRSATLQTYHHAGAMLCMWAGIRYMSPPIWMFVFINSFIHSLMYTYFTLSALEIKVPLAFKRLLTTLQILQILWGSSYAAAHLFIAYGIPISTPYQVAHTIQAVASSVSSAALAASSSASSAASAASSTASKIVASPAASGTLGAFVKKMLLRAVGEEGVAERVTNNQGDIIAAEPIKEHIIQAEERATQQYYETRYHSDLTKINCIDTSGEAFAIYLNLVYLYPLMFLFARFFIKAYVSRGKPQTAKDVARKAIESGKEAEVKTEESLDEAGIKAEDEFSEQAQQLRKDVQYIKDGNFGEKGRRVSDHVSNFERQIKSGVEKAKEQGKKLVNGSGTSSPRRGSPSKKRPAGMGEGRDESAIEEEPPSQPQQKRDEGDEKEGGAGLLPQTPSKEKEDRDVSKPANGDDGASAEETQSESTDPFTSSGTGAAQHDEHDEEDDKENQAPHAPSAVAQEAKNEPSADSEPAQKQEENLAGSQFTRPGTTDEEPVTSSESAGAAAAESDEKKDEAEEDTDAMGKSGAIVDFVHEKAQEAADDLSGEAGKKKPTSE